MNFFDRAMSDAIRGRIDTDATVAGPEELGYCGSCRWLFNRTPNDGGLCGTCRRERGLEESDVLTVEFDRRVREFQREMQSR
jgi:hypothetical protein